MRKLIIKLFAGDPIKTATFMFPLMALLGISIAINYGWETTWYNIVLVLLIAVVVFISYIYLRYINKPKREELSDKDKVIYDYLNNK